MPFKHGKNTEVWLAGADVSTYLNSLGFNVDADTAETTTFKATWKTHLPGVAGATVEAGGFYDPTTPAFSGTVPAASSGSVLTIGPAGMAAIGDLARLVSIYATKYAESPQVGDAVAFSWSVLTDGAVAFGYALHPLAADTNTTTGADRDDGAATATGWTAHLHVTAASAGSWVVKLQDAATTDWTDVTSGAFTAATGATSQRLRGAAGATLRRHVRYVATRTGGSASDTLTFGLAVARN